MHRNQNLFPLTFCQVTVKTQATFCLTSTYCFASSTSSFSLRASFCSEPATTCFAKDAKAEQVKVTSEFCFARSKKPYYRPNLPFSYCKAETQKAVLENPDSSISYNVPEIKLFVNLLMKHGKKTKALYILEVAALLFIKSISKTDLYLEPKTASLGLQGNSFCPLQSKTATPNHNKSIAKHLHSKKQSNDSLYRSKLRPDVVAVLPVSDGFLALSAPFASFAKQVAESAKPASSKQQQGAKPASSRQKQQSNCIAKSQQRQSLLFSFVEQYAKSKGTAHLSFFSLVSLKGFLQDFYIKRRAFANSNFTYKRYRGLAFLNEKVLPSKQSFGLRPYIIEAPIKKSEASASINDVSKGLAGFLALSAPFASFAKQVAESAKPASSQQKQGGPRKQEQEIAKDKRRFWYIKKTPDRWHQLSDIQKNTLLFALYTAISNVKPPLEVRSKRVGGSNRQIPAAVSENRQGGYAIRWIIESANMDKAQGRQRKKRVKTTNLLQSKPLQSKSILLSNKQKANTGLASEMPYYAVAEQKSANQVQGTCSAGAYDWTGEKSKKQNFVPLFCISLADALKNAFYKKGSAFQKRNLWIETAQANRAFLRYRWW